MLNVIIVGVVMHFMRFRALHDAGTGPVMNDEGPERFHLEKLRRLRPVFQVTYRYLPERGAQLASKKGCSVCLRLRCFQKMQQKFSPARLPSDPKALVGPDSGLFIINLNIAE